MLIDLDRFKARNPLRDLTFYAALFTTLAMLIPQLERAWRERSIDAGELGVAVAPLTAWLVANGYVRGKGVEAAGFAQAAASAAPAPVLITSQAPLSDAERAALEAKVQAAYMGEALPTDDELIDEPDDGFGAVSTGGAHDAVSVAAEQADAATIETPIAEQTDRDGAA